MSPENTKLVQEAVKRAGKNLEGKLPQRNHLVKRNSYAHLWERIKNKFGKSYKDCDDSQLSEIIDLIDWCEKNPG